MLLTVVPAVVAVDGNVTELVKATGVFVVTVVVTAEEGALTIMAAVDPCVSNVGLVVLFGDGEVEVVSVTVVDIGGSVVGWVVAEVTKSICRDVEGVTEGRDVDDVAVKLAVTVTGELGEGLETACEVLIRGTPLVE